MTAARRRVTHVSPYFPPHIGGLQRVAADLATGLSDRYDVVVLTSAVGAGAGRSTEGRVRIQRLRAFELGHTPFMPGLPLALFRARGQLVHLHLSQVFVQDVTALLCRVLGTPYVAHHHLDVQPSGLFGRFFQLYKRLLYPSVLRRAEAVIALTEHDRQMLLGRYDVDAGRVRVIPNGVRRHDIGVLPDRRRTGPLRLLFVGRLSPQKNLALLLRALEHADFPYELRIAGDGPERSRLEAQVGGAGQGDVRFLGVQDPQALPDLYRWADLLTLTSTVEGAPMVLLEAMAHGLPSMVTDVSGLPDLVGPAGVAVPSDPAQIVACLSRLHQDRSQLEVLRAQAVARSAEFDLDATTAQIDGLYCELLR